MGVRGIDLANAIYDAVLDPRGLWVFADFVAAALGASSSVLHEIDGPCAVATVSSGIAASAHAAYERYYHQVNPLLPAALERMAVGRTACIGDLLPERDYFNSEFYCDFARGAGTAWVLGMNVEVAPDRMLAVATHRAPGDPDFGAAERARLLRLRGPIAGALRLRERLGETGLAGMHALDAFAFGAVVCDRDGRLVFANGAAEALARSNRGLVLAARRGGVTAVRPDEAGRLAHLVKKAAEDGCAGAMSLTGDTGQPTALLVTPLPRRSDPRASLALVTLGETARDADTATLRAVFGLTPAEAAVAAALSTGAAAAGIAADLGVAEATVRTHIRRCLAKAGVATQREFVARLGRLPPVARRPALH